MIVNVCICLYMFLWSWLWMSIYISFALMSTDYWLLSPKGDVANDFLNPGLLSIESVVIHWFLSTYITAMGYLGPVTTKTMLILFYKVNIICFHLWWYQAMMWTFCIWRWKYNKLAKLRRHASRVHIAKIHFGKINFE